MRFGWDVKSERSNETITPTGWPAGPPPVDENSFPGPDWLLSLDIV